MTKRSTAPALPDAAPPRTPENTPLPGGGRWRWDEATANWAEMVDDVPAAAPDQAEPTPTATDAPLTQE